MTDSVWLSATKENNNNVIGYTQKKQLNIEFLHTYCIIRSNVCWDFQQIKC